MDDFVNHSCTGTNYKIAFHEGGSIPERGLETFKSDRTGLAIIVITSVGGGTCTEIQGCQLPGAPTAEHQPCTIHPPGKTISEPELFEEIF